MHDGEWDSTEWRKVRNLKILEWFHGNQAAVDCFVMISQIAETWDDLVDKGEANEGDVERSYMNALIGLECNKFYTENRPMILPIMIIMMNGWLDSNEMVHTASKENHVKAYVLRNLGLELLPLFAFLTGGYDHMRKVSLEMREFFTHDDFDEWEAKECST